METVIPDPAMALPAVCIPDGAIRPLPRDKFDAYVAATRLPGHEVFAREMAWFATAGDKVIGAVVTDTTDHDWGYVVMSRLPSPGQGYQFVDAACSFPTREKATEALTQAMWRLTEGG